MWGISAAPLKFWTGRPAGGASTASLSHAVGQAGHLAPGSAPVSVFPAPRGSGDVWEGATRHSGEDHAAVSPASRAL